MGEGWRKGEGWRLEDVGMRGGRRKKQVGWVEKKVKGGVLMKGEAANGTTLTFRTKNLRPGQSQPPPISQITFPMKGEGKGIRVNNTATQFVRELASNTRPALRPNPQFLTLHSISSDCNRGQLVKTEGRERRY